MLKKANRGTHVSWRSSKGNQAPEQVYAFYLHAVQTTQLSMDLWVSWDWSFLLHDWHHPVLSESPVFMTPQEPSEKAVVDYAKIALTVTCNVPGVTCPSKLTPLLFMWLKEATASPHWSDLCVLENTSALIEHINTWHIDEKGSQRLIGLWRKGRIMVTLWHL